MVIYDFKTKMFVMFEMSAAYVDVPAGGEDDAVSCWLGASKRSCVPFA